MHGLEIDSLVKLSKLNDVAISPKIVERQLVSTCLWVFCDKRITALETNTGTDKDSAMRTINFLKYWKIVNVIGVSADIEFNYQLRAVVRPTCDHRLEFLLKLADIADGMTNSSNKRIQKLTRVTDHVPSLACRGPGSYWGVVYHS